MSSAEQGGAGAAAPIRQLSTVLFAAAATAMITVQPRLALPSFEIGKPATSDVSAPATLRIPDPEATEQRRRAAEAEELPLYDHDPRKYQTFQLRLVELFEAGRALPAAAAKAPAAAAALEAVWGRPLSSAGVGALLRTRFDPELEDRLIQTLQGVSARLVIDDLLRLAPSSLARGIRVRTLPAGGERTVTDPAGLLDLQGLMLRLEVALERLDLERREGRALAEMVAEAMGPNLTFNSKETDEARAKARARVGEVFYQVERGQKLVRRGDLVSPEIYRQLEAAGSLKAGERTVPHIAATFVLVWMLLLGMGLYLRHYRTRQRWIPKLDLKLGLLWLGLLLIHKIGFKLAEFVGEAVERYPFDRPEAYAFAIPFAAGGMLLTLLVGVHLAAIFSIFNAATVGILNGELGLTLFALISSFASIYSLTRFEKRTALMRSGLLLGTTQALVVPLVLVQFGAGAAGAALPEAGALWLAIGCAFCGGIAVVMLVTLLLPPLEVLFGVPTDIRLLELSNLNLPLLRELALKAPGSYQHSIAVGSLAEAAAAAIAVNPLMLRVGAYYHDIGKIAAPQYFVENLRGRSNPHDALDPLESSRRIVNHVQRGLELARQHRLPQAIADMIPQHHGTRLVGYFHDKARSGAQGAAVPESDYRYPGPKPRTKEAAILMLADAVEAASRTLRQPTAERLRATIRTLFNAIVAEGQLDQCDLTLRDLDRIAQAFQEVLSGILHHRIDYPGYDFNDEKTDPQSGPPLEPPADRPAGEALLGVERLPGKIH
ncbi:MAG TPA: HDIG domain-containing protein [Acidobacteriota bacterium]